MIITESSNTINSNRLLSESFVLLQTNIEYSSIVVITKNVITINTFEYQTKLIEISHLIYYSW